MLLTFTERDVDRIFSRRNISSVGVPREASQVEFPR